MLASAEAVARRLPSGENLAEVMPRAWALGSVKRGVNVNLGLRWWLGEGVREVVLREWERGVS